MDNSMLLETSAIKCQCMLSLYAAFKTVACRTIFKCVRTVAWRGEIQESHFTSRTRLGNCTTQSATGAWGRTREDTRLRCCSSSTDVHCLFLLRYATGETRQNRDMGLKLYTATQQRQEPKLPVFNDYFISRIWPRGNWNDASKKPFLDLWKTCPTERQHDHSADYPVLPPTSKTPTQMLDNLSFKWRTNSLKET